MVESSEVPVVDVTSDGVVKNWNHAAESLFGYSASEIIGRPVAILGSCEDRHQKVDTLRRVRAGDMVRDLKTVRIAKDGRKISVLLTVAPIKDQAGAVVGMSTCVTDMTRSEQVVVASK